MDRKAQPPPEAQPGAGASEADSETRPARELPRRFTLPNGMEVAYQSRAEVEFFYKDIFEKEIYLKHRVTLSDGDCVFDIGANIGLFTLFAHRKCRGVKIYAFEPAPPLFEILRQNVSRYGVDAKLFNCGLSSEAKTTAFTFYPNSSGMSSFYADRREEKEALRAIMENQLRQGAEGMSRVMRHADELLEERLKSETYDCRLRTVAEVMREERVERVDLMKIDVQKSESDVVAGIGDEGWPKIKQLVVEVHDIGGRLRQMIDLLEARGYRVAVEQDDHYHHSILFNLFAVRSEPTPAPGGTMNASALRQIHERARKQEEAARLRKRLLEQRTKDNEPG